MRNGSAGSCPPRFVAFSHLPAKTSATMLASPRRTTHSYRLVIWPIAYSARLSENLSVSFSRLFGFDHSPVPYKVARPSVAVYFDPATTRCWPGVTSPWITFCSVKVTAPCGPTVPVSSIRPSPSVGYQATAPNAFPARSLTNSTIG